MKNMNANSYVTGLFNEWGPPLLYIDLDGTISERDVIDRRLLENVSVFANTLTPFGDDRWRPRFPFLRKGYADGCATCKPRVMQVTNPDAAPTVFVGDGLSDRFAAKAATVVFAKDK